MVRDLRLGGALVGALLNAPWVATWSWADRRPATDRRSRPRPARARIVRDRTDRFRRTGGRAVPPRDRRGRAGQGVAPHLGRARRRRRARVRRARRRRRPRGVPVRSARGRRAARAGGVRRVDLGGGGAGRRSTSTSAAAGSAGGSRSVCWRWSPSSSGIVPGVAAIGDGRWKTPTTTLGRLMNAWLVDEPADGDYRVLLLGDSRVLPVPSTEYRDGISWALIDDGDLDVRDRWAPPDTRPPASSTARSTRSRRRRRCAPAACSPRSASATSSSPSSTAWCRRPTTRSPVADGLSAALDDQLDLRHGERRLPDARDLRELGAWLPTDSLLAGAAAAASTTAGIEALLRANLTEAVPIMPGADQFDVVLRRRHPRRRPARRAVRRELDADRRR